MLQTNSKTSRYDPCRALPLKPRTSQQARKLKIAQHAGSAEGCEAAASRVPALQSQCLSAGKAYRRDQHMSACCDASSASQGPQAVHAPDHCFAGSPGHPGSVSAVAANSCLCTPGGRHGALETSQSAAVFSQTVSACCVRPKTWPMPRDASETAQQAQVSSGRLYHGQNAHRSCVERHHVCMPACQQCDCSFAAAPGAHFVVPTLDDHPGAQAAAVRAWQAGIRRQRIELLLPLIGATDLDDWPGGIRQQFKAVLPMCATSASYCSVCLAWRSLGNLPSRAMLPASHLPLTHNRRTL